LIVAVQSVYAQPAGFQDAISGETRIVVGQAAPPIGIVDALGTRREHSNTTEPGILILTFFPRCFTFNCANQLSSFRDSYAELQVNGVEVCGVSVDPADGPHGQKAFARYLKLPFPLIPDVDRKICLAYGAVRATDQMAARMTVIIDKDGIVRDIDKQISPRTQGPDVLAKLRALGLIPLAGATSPQIVAPVAAVTKPG